MRFLPIVILLGACDYEAPIVPATDNDGNPKPVLNVISGDIVLGVPVTDVSQVVVFVTDAANPMPPTGTGRPKTFTTVRAKDFSEADQSGLRSAKWSVSNVPDGEWIITAFMDLDGDFNPLVSAMGGATCGDIGGAHLTDLVTQEFATVRTAGGELVDDVTVLLASQFPFERPALTVQSDGTTSKTENIIVVNEAAADPTGKGVFTLHATGIHSEIYDLANPELHPSQGGADPCGVVFPMYAEDGDGDGFADPHWNYGDNGLYKVWPRVYLSYLGTPVQNDDGSVTFENDLAVGEVWAAESVPNPQYILFGQVLPNQFTYFKSAEYVWLPGARHITAENPEGEVITDVSLIPRGAWSITMISYTGQTWTIPNTLAYYDLGANPTGFDPVKQLGWLEVQ